MEMQEKTNKNGLCTSEAESIWQWKQSNFLNVGIEGGPQKFSLAVPTFSEKCMQSNNNEEFATNELARTPQSPTSPRSRYEEELQQEE